MKRKELDLLRSYHRKEEQRLPAVITVFLPSLIIIAAALCLWGIFHWQSSALQQEISLREAWLTQHAERSDKAEETWAYNEALMERLRRMEALDAALATYPKVTLSLAQTLFAAGGEHVETTLTGYDAKTGELLFIAQSPQALDIPAYVRALRKTELFSHVDYSGYRYEDSTYRLNLCCILKEGGAP